MHPGHGFALPVDAHPVALTRGGKNNKSASCWRNRIQSYDSTFGLAADRRAPAPLQLQALHIPSLPAVSVFDDLLEYYNERIPLNSVDHPHSGTMIEVLSTVMSADGGSYMAIQVTAPQLIE